MIRYPISAIGGNVGRALRQLYYKTQFRSLGNNLIIERGVYISSPSELTVGDDCYINTGTRIISDGGLVVGNDVMIGNDALILTISHGTHDPTRPIREQEDDKKAVSIDDGAWICSRAILLPGVHVHKGAVVGAGAVATKDVHEYSIVVGNPAKVKYYREMEVLREC